MAGQGRVGAACGPRGGRRNRMTPDDLAPENGLDGLVRARLNGQLSRRGFISRVMALGVSASGAAALLAACQGSTSSSGSPSSPGTATRKPVIRVAYSGAPNGFDPGKAAVSYSHYIIVVVFSPRAG